MFSTLIPVSSTKSLSATVSVSPMSFRSNLLSWTIPHGEDAGGDRGLSHADRAATANRGDDPCNTEGSYMSARRYIHLLLLQYASCVL
jgi:hypothetical protein